MLEKNQEKIKSKAGNMKIWAIYLTILVIIGGAILTGIVLERVLKKSPGGSLEVSTRKVEALKSFLGAEVMGLNDMIRKQLDISTDQGALVNSVIDGSPADKAGVQRGDVIMRFDRQRVRDVAHLQELIADTSPGDRVKVVVEREENAKVFYVKLGEIPATGYSVALTQAQPPEQTPQQPGWGMGVAPITPDMGQGFGLAQGQKGILVTSIIPGGAAGAAGIQAGDIILSANTQPTAELSQFYEAIAGSQSVVLDIFRTGQVSYVPVQADPSQQPTASLGMTTELTAGGNPNQSDDEGYKGMPPLIPPKGEYDPETMGSRTTAGTQNRVEVCVCPSCGTTVSHQPGIPCSQMNCPVCGSRLINASPGIATSYDDSRVPQQGDPQRPSYAGAAKGQRDLNPTSLGAIQTGGGSSEDDDEGHKPSTIPPMGNPGDGANVVNIWQISGQPTSSQPSDVPSMGKPTGGGQTAGAQTTIPSIGIPTGGGQTAGAQTTAGTVNRVQVCICPVCGITVGHPAGIPCSELTCPDCGSRLIPLNPGASSSTTQQGESMQQGNRPASAGQGMAQGGSSGSGGSSGYGSSSSGGPTGECVCPACGTLVSHTVGVPCYELTCPKCGTLMVRAIPGVTISGMPETIPPPDKGQQSAITTAASLSQKLAISSEGRNLSSKIAPLFDRAPYFIIVGLGSFQAIRNPNANDSKEVGIQSAQFVVDKGTGAVITNNISLEAMEELRKLNVSVYSGVSGTVSQALEWYMDGRLKETTVGSDKSDSGSREEGEGNPKRGRDTQRANVVL